MLQELYQDMIIDHSKSPRNFYKMDDCDRKIEGYNPLCGDRFTLYLKLDGDKISDLSFEGSGCAISTASASLMTESVKSKKIEEVEKLISAFHHLIKGEDKGAVDLEKLEVFSGVQEFPTRVKCAVLAWHALKGVLHGKTEAISTE